MRTIAPSAIGVGLRAEHAQWLADNDPQPGIDFLEITLENWLGIGGRKRGQLERIAEKYPLIAHGLSLSIGDELPLNREHVAQARRFLDHYGISLYSDHLSYSRDSQGYLYELLPLPRSEAEAKRIAAKIRQAQDMLARPLILENISYYHQHPGQLDEADFICAVAERSGCQLLLDINNVRVNAANHDYQAERFIDALPTGLIRYFHIAGHWRREDGMLIDTHGEPVCAEVEALARHAVAVHGPHPLVLERDNRLPPWPDLCDEAVALGRRLYPVQEKEKP